MVKATQTAKIVGNADNIKWGGVFSENGLFIVVEVMGSEEKHAVNTGKEILDLLLTKFTNVKERSSGTISQLLDVVLDREEINSLVIGLLENDQLFLGSLKEATVYLMRDKKLGRILSGSVQMKGEANEEDLFLICSKTFDLLVPKEKVNEALLIHDPEQIAAQIAPLVLENKEAYGACGLVVKTSSELQEKIEQSPDISDFKNSFAERISTVTGRIKDLVKIRQLKLPWISKTQEYQDPEKTRTKKTLLTVSVVLVVLLVLSVFFNINHTRDTKRQEKLGEVLALVTQQYEEAVNLIDLNPVRARELLASGKLSLSPLLSEFPKESSEYKQANEWMVKISSQEVTAYKIYKLTAVPLFFDLYLVKAGAEGKKMTSYKDIKAILDTKNQTVYTLSTTNKQSNIIAGSDTVKDAQNIAVHGNNIYILNSDGIVGIDILSKTAKVMIKSDEKWGEIGSLESFGGNLYLLDKRKNTIWKYVATDFGLSAITTYLNRDVKVNFSQAIRMDIDGSVWVAYPSEILKFTRGLGEQFAFKGFSELLSNITAISTSDTNNFIYLLDKSTTRIVVFDKDGAYQSQYQWDELISADDIVASEEEKKIFVLMGSKIYAIDIQ